MRSIAFAIFTPFFLIKAGLFVSLPALWAALGSVAVLLVLKLITRFIGVRPLSRLFHMRAREANYTTLLRSTGLTFGTISALSGLQNKIISQEQYSVLVTILSAIVPTIIAQKLFEPTIETMNEWGKIYREKQRKKPLNRYTVATGLTIRRFNGSTRPQKHVHKSPCRLRRFPRRPGGSAPCCRDGQKI